MKHLIDEFLLRDCAAEPYGFVNHGKRHRPDSVPVAQGGKLLNFDNVGSDLWAFQGQSVGHPGHVGTIHSSRRYEYLKVHRLVDLAQAFAGIHAQGAYPPRNGLNVLNDRR